MALATLSRPSHAATACQNPLVPIATATTPLPPPPTNPSNVALVSWFTSARRSPAFYTNTKYGVMGVYLGSNPGAPTPTFTPISFRAGGPIGGGTTIDCWPGPSNMAIADAGNGAGRMVTGWNDGGGCGEPEQMLALTSPGGSSTYGQQIDVSGTSTNVSTGAIAAALTSGGNYAGYFTDKNGTYVVNVTSPAYNGRANPLGASQTLVAWANASRFAALGGSGFGDHDSYLAAMFSTSSGASVQIASIASDGKLTVLPAHVSLSGASASGVAAEQFVAYPTSTGYFLFAAVSGGVDVLFFDGTNLTRKGLIPNVGTTKYNRIQVPVDSPSPIVVLERNFPPSLDVYAGGYLTGGSGSPSLATSIPELTNDSLAGFAAYVDSSNPRTLYVYRPVAASNLYLQTDTYDISCIASPPTPNPKASFALTNKSSQTRTDKANYVGDTFSLVDNSTAGTGGAITNWYLWSSYASATSNKGNADLSSTFAPSLPTLVLPCTGGIVSGQCSYSPASIQGTSISETFGELVSAGSLDSPAYSSAVTLAVPVTKVSGRGSDGSVKVLSGGSIDATPSTGSPATFAWIFRNSASATIATSCAAATCVPPVGAATYSVSAHYAGGYNSPAVTGSVVFTDVAGSVTVPASVQSGQGEIPVTIDLVKGSAVTIADVDYSIDGSVPKSLSLTNVTKTTTTYKASASIVIPAGLALDNSHNINFDVHYSGGSIGSVVSFPSTFFYSSVQYTPLVWISKLQSLTSTDTCFVSVFQGAQEVCSGAPGTFYLSDPGDSGSAAVAATWDFGDGSPVDTGHTTKDFVSHSYPTKGNYTVKLTVAGTISSQLFSVTSVAPPPFTATISGPTTLTTGSSGTWTASASGGTSPYSYSWTSSDGGSGTGASFSHAFSTSGSFSVSATATDSASHSAHPSKSVSVGIVSGGCVNKICVAGPPSVAQNSSGTYTASVSGVSAGSLAIDWTITGPGISAVHKTGTSISFVFPSPGSYTLKVTGYQNVGTWIPIPTGATVNVSVTAVSQCGGQPCPDASFDISGAQASPYTGGYSAKTGDLITFTAHDSLAASYAWDFNDGSHGSAKSVGHQFLTQGQFRVALQVQSPLGFSASSHQTLAVDGPPAFSALMIPGSGHYADASGDFSTELSLFNNSDNPLDVALAFVAGAVDPTHLPFPTAGQVGAFTIAPHAGWTSSDVTTGFLGAGNQSLGTLFIKYTGVKPGVQAKIYFSHGEGQPSFGTYLSAYPIGPAGLSLESGSLVQTTVGMKDDPDYSGGLTILSASPLGGKFDVSVFRADGTPAGQILHLSLAGFQQSKLHLSDLSVSGGAGEMYYAQVGPTPGTTARPFVAIGTVTDRHTKDSLLIGDDTPRQAAVPGATASYFVPLVGRTDSGFRTDLYLVNTSSYGVPLTYTFHVRNGGTDQSIDGDVTTYGTLGPGQAFQISDVISTLFPALSGTVIGDLRIGYTVPQDAGQSSSRLVVESRNYAGGSQGTYGMQLPAYAATDGLVPGSTARIMLPGLHNDANATATGYDYTSRFGFIALGDDPVTVHADAYDQADGTLFWSGDYPLNGAAYGHFVFVSTTGQFAPAPFATHPRFDIVVSATGSGNTPAGAFATVQDMRSMDLVFLPGKNAP